MKAAASERAPLALYRKYRPSVFGEVLGQQQVVSVLGAAVAQKKIFHAYLFAGGRGTGKTSMARILARALGTHERDIYELDAASNRGIDEIRELREGVATLPFESTYKFYILDEAHALTPAAWGALLKTLEEPPAHVIFVLATTEIDKVPETIISRCQVFRFKQPPQETLKQVALDVATKEGFSLAPAGAELIALMGDGSFRDTLGILQQVLTVSKEKKISEDAVANIVGAPSSKVINDFLGYLATSDLAQALRIFHEAQTNGIEPKIFSLLLLEKIRAVLLLRFAPSLKKELQEQFSENDLKILESFAGAQGMAINSQLLAELINAHIEMARTPIPSIPLELALYRVFGEK